EGGRARGAELRVHPRHHPGRRVVRGVGHVHAARGAEDDGPRPGRLDHELHDQGRLAALAGPVTGGEVLLEGDLLDALEGLEDLGRVAEGLGHGLSLLESLASDGGAPAPRRPAARKAIIPARPASGSWGRTSRTWRRRSTYPSPCRRPP